MSVCATTRDTQAKVFIANLAFLNRLLDLLDLDFAETFDLQERLAGRGVDGLWFVPTIMVSDLSSTPTPTNDDATRDDRRGWL